MSSVLERCKEYLKGETAMQFRMSDLAALIEVAAAAQLYLAEHSAYIGEAGNNLIDTVARLSHENKEPRRKGA